MFIHLVCYSILCCSVFVIDLFCTCLLSAGPFLLSHCVLVNFGAVQLSVGPFCAVQLCTGPFCEDQFRAGPALC